MSADLPPLIYFNDYGGDWRSYCDALYALFLKTLIESGITYQGHKVSCRYFQQPNNCQPYENKHASFWHLISEGEKEEERTPDIKRCERILWISWIIENASKDGRIRIIQQNRDSRISHVLWLYQERYVVVLAIRQKYYLLQTAYIADPHKLVTLEKEWEACTKARAAGKTAP
jgi:hypothetical protein